MSDIYYLGEGKSEKNVISALSLFGKHLIFKIWDWDIKKIFRELQDKSEVILMVDADQHTKDACRTRFENNIKALVKAGYTVKVLLQVNDLEDEIITACRKEHLKNFGVTSKSELKDKILKISNLDNKFKNNLFDEKLLWKQPHEKIDAICQELKEELELKADLRVDISKLTQFKKQGSQITR